MLTRARLREKVTPVARRVAGLSQVHRLCIIYLLAHEPQTPHVLAQNVGIAENLIAHHLKKLRLAGWVTRTGQGRQTVYSLKSKTFLEIGRLFEDTPFEKDVLSKHFR